MSDKPNGISKSDLLDLTPDLLDLAPSTQLLHNCRYKGVKRMTYDKTACILKNSLPEV